MKRRCVTCGHDEFDDDGRPTHTYLFCWVDGCDMSHTFQPEILVPTPVGGSHG